MIQLNMIKRTKSTHILALFFGCRASNTRTPSRRITQGPFTLPGSMALCTDAWWSSQSKRHTQTLVICSPTKCPQSGSDTRCHAHCQTSTAGRSRRLIRCDANAPSSWRWLCHHANKDGHICDSGLPFMCHTSPEPADWVIMRRVRRWRWCWDLLGRIPGIEYRSRDESGGSRGGLIVWGFRRVTY